MSKRREPTPGMVKCRKCGQQFDPRVQSAACHAGVRHFPIKQTSGWQPPAQPSNSDKPRRRADFQSDFMLLWDETQTKPRAP
jgi:hypothetical protein